MCQERDEHCEHSTYYEALCLTTATVQMYSVSFSLENLEVRARAIYNVEVLKDHVL